MHISTLRMLTTLIMIFFLYTYVRSCIFISVSIGYFQNYDYHCHPWPSFLYHHLTYKYIKVAKGDEANYGSENTLVRL